MRKVLCTIILLAALAISASAQVVYSCDFESVAENARWTLNQAANTQQAALLQNKWYIGRLGNASATGKFGLFVSSDNAVSTTYSNVKGNFVSAYREMTLQPGTYRVRFDWMAMGSGANDGLYVAWLPQTTKTYSAFMGATTPPATYTNAVHFFGQKSGIWHPATLDINVSAADSQGKLVFLWYNNTGAIMPPAACVDNVEICSMPVSCAAPTGLRYDNLTSRLSWTGTPGATYDVRIYNSYDKTWEESYGVTGTSYTMRSQVAGFRYFMVRKACSATDHSDWVVKNEFVYFPLEGCIDYLNLSGPNTKCYTGNANSGDYNAFKNLTGPQNNRHTIHYDPAEYDAETGYGLHVIPDGELATVRLGNNSSGAEAEGIVYTLTIPKNETKILKLKYALVLENGGHDLGGPEAGAHTSNEQSHFYVEVRNSRNQQVEPGCYCFNFSADPTIINRDPTWHINGNVVWKDWTEVAISLAKYTGQTITLRLSNYDCTASGHFGYAYFAISCENGDLKGVTCGDYNMTEFIAPSGFNYAWYSAAAPNITLSRKDTFRLADPLDTTLYRVDVISKTTGCSYTLTADPNPRFPHPAVEWAHQPANCQNKVTFHDRSMVEIRYRNDSTIKGYTDLGLDQTYIDFGDGTQVLAFPDSIISHVYPETGGTFPVKIYSTISNGVCGSVLDSVLVLPDLTADTLLPAITKCEGDVYITNKKKIRITKDEATMQVVGTDTSYVYMDTLGGAFNPAGCEIDQFQPVVFHKEFHSFKKDTICLGKPYHWGDTDYYETNPDIQYQLKSAFGCDSIAHLDLYVQPRLMTNAYPLYACSGDEVMLITSREEGTYEKIHKYSGSKYEGRPVVMAYTTGSSNEKNWLDLYAGMRILTDSAAQADGFEAEYFFKPGEDWIIDLPAEKMRPNNYVFTFITETNCDCAEHSYKRAVDIRYGYEAVDANYAYITTTGPRYNGGYDLETNKVYQWYRDAEPIIPGGDEYYLKTIWEEDIDHVYYCVITDTITGEETKTCPIEYGAMDPTVNQMEDVRVGFDQISSSDTYRVYNIYGHFIGTLSNTSRAASDTIPMEALKQKGLYILVSEDANNVVKILVP